ncbi:MAG: penicillin-binding protein 1B [Pseudomonadota bacterium]
MLLLLLVAGAGGVLWLDRVVVQEFEARRFDTPARVYAQPIELYAGAPRNDEQLQEGLRRLGYVKSRSMVTPGTYTADGDRLEVHTRPFVFWDGPQPARRLSLTFANGRIAALEDARGDPVALARLDPRQVGSLLAANGEDRILLADGELPAALRDALLASEDRRFYEHAGIDWTAIARAAWINLRAGEIRQGGSTLTQQLVKSFFLTNERTYRRKFTEVVMALILDARYDKSALLHAYSNEIYLGQDGGRAIHGFGLASQFLFSRPVGELELHQLALLVALVRGPSLYDPRRHPERALERRNLVLNLMAEQGFLDAPLASQAIAQPLDITAAPARGSDVYPAYMDLVKKQLSEHYDSRQLSRAGLRIFTALDPVVQGAAERSLAEQLTAMPAQAPLQGAMVVTTTEGGEVLAVVGGRQAAFDGFNRALDARRPLGSLVKPVLYLAAIEQGNYHLASLLDNSPVSLQMPNGNTWEPQNFDGTTGEPVPLFRALADSVNLPAVHTALALGPQAVADTLFEAGARQALDRGGPAYPSIALGAVDVSALEVAQVYNTLANGGFYTPLRAVLEVVDAQGVPLERYPLALESVADAAATQQVNAGMVLTMRDGTGRSARSRLGADIELAGKTGTTNDFRDSWFAGFSRDVLAVVWVGNDDNRPTGLTGASGALKVWSDFMQTQPLHDVELMQPAGLAVQWVEPESGRLSDPACGSVVALPLPADAALEPLDGCRVSRPDQPRENVASRTWRWLKDRFRR